MLHCSHCMQTPLRCGPRPHLPAPAPSSTRPSYLFSLAANCLYILFTSEYARMFCCLPSLFPNLTLILPEHIFIPASFSSLMRWNYLSPKRFFAGHTKTLWTKLLCMHLPGSKPGPFLRSKKPVVRYRDHLSILTGKPKDQRCQTYLPEGNGKWVRVFNQPWILKESRISLFIHSHLWIIFYMPIPVLGVGKIKVTTMHLCSLGFHNMVGRTEQKLRPSCLVEKTLQPRKWLAFSLR